MKGNSHTAAGDPRWLAAVETGAERPAGRPHRWLLALYLPPLAALLLVVLISALTGTPVAYFTRDPADIAQISPFAGVISNLGILGWCATVTVCALVAVLVTRAEGRSPLSRFFLASAGLSALLLLDDFFLFHERVFPIYLHLRQRYVYFCYAATVGLYLFAFRQVILRSAWGLLLVALACFSLSILVDVAAGRLAGRLPDLHLLEDGAKFLGIASWFGYFGRLAVQRLTVAPPGPGAGESP